MEEKSYTGLELLDTLKKNLVPDNTIIKVYKDNKELCYLKWIDGDIKWRPSAKFKLAMLIKDNYTYELISRDSIINGLKDMDVDTNDIRVILKFIDSVLYHVD